MKTIIAILLYKIGIRPNVSTLIDEKTTTYGYGNLDELGIWEYDLPSKYVRRK
jgi:hypothetical protein